MRKYIRYIKYMLAMTLIFLMFPANVMAEDTVSSQDNWVEFDKDHRMTDNFESRGITDEAKNDLQPGDTMTFKVNLKNTSKDKTAWYMRNEVLQTLETQQSIAEGGVYTYVLTYIGPKGTKVLYDSEAVGGSGGAAGGNTGLEQATVALDNEKYIYLDNLAPGAEAQMTLKIGLDGETQGNNYQDTLARVELGFAVELVDDASTGTPSSNRRVVTQPKTGDTSRMMLFSIVTLVSGVACILLVLFRLKKRKICTEKKERRRTGA